MRQLQRNHSRDAILPDMDDAKIIAAVKEEMAEHDWTTFVDDPPAIGRGGQGVVIPGCPKCRKRLNTTNQYLTHLFDDVLTQVLEKALTDAEKH
jgi:hypothetical protein